MPTQKRSAEEKVRILQELAIWESQGKPASIFAKAHGIGRKNLYNWKARRLQLEQIASESSRVNVQPFVQVQSAIRRSRKTPEKSSVAIQITTTQLKIDVPVGFTETDLKIILTRVGGSHAR